MDQRFLKPYNPAEVEQELYQKWEAGGYFKPRGSGQPFSMVLPPPNVTGTLHMGSALMLALEDVMVRYARMSGRQTLWIPGTDHAAIATQTKVEKILEKEGVKKKDLGREEFLKRVEQFASESHAAIVEQIRTLGASVDWSREAYTLDAARSRAVREAFKRMYEAGLIYRGLRVINWDPKGQTAIADDEIVYEERPTMLYTFRYSAEFPIPIATTRPETKLGDTGVAVHPDDARYQKYIGQTFTIADFAGYPLTIKVVADPSVDPNFGTGAVGLTPAHSQIDAEIAERHGLPSIQVIDEFAKISQGPLAGQKVTAAREAVAEWLKNNNLLEKAETITHNIATAERSGAVIEPLPKQQWFVAVDKEFDQRGRRTTLKRLMIEAVESGRIKIVPERFAKIYFNWVANLHDWCISRQIWFGHRIPVWYRSTSSNGKSSEVETYVGIEAPTGEGWAQDPDTLDTWFSSGLWTFSTLGWPDETADLKTFHPTTILETAYDILFFWVARMILMTGFLLDEIPFHTVYLHGLVRDKDGRKISKSLGNNVDPLELAAQYGADAVRLSLIIGTGPGNDSKISPDKLKAYKHFANKIWNASRFVIENEVTSPPPPAEHPYLTELEQLTAELSADLDNFRYHLAGEKLYHFFWHRFADTIIEAAKTDTQIKSLLPTMLARLLTLLHPFMPFVTEAVWSLWQPTKPPLIITPWPHSNSTA